MTTMTTTCPAWCHRHPWNEFPDSHQSASWDRLGLSMVIEQTETGGTTIEVDTDASLEGYLSLTPEQALELGAELVRAAERIREARRLTPDA